VVLDLNLVILIIRRLLLVLLVLPVLFLACPRLRTSRVTSSPWVPRGGKDSLTRAGVSFYFPCFFQLFKLVALDHRWVLCVGGRYVC
jgi:hypothetical protein